MKAVRKWAYRCLSYKTHPLRGGGNSAAAAPCQPIGMDSSGYPNWDA